MKSINKLLLLIVLLTPHVVCRAQNVAVKSNLLYWATTTANLSVEVGVGKRATIDIQGSYNPWVFGDKQDNKKLNHWLVMPEMRLWLYEKFDGHFFGFHLLYSRYNAGGVDLPLGIFSQLRENRYEGYGMGAGLSYGYQFYLGPHWNLETTLGVGYSYMNFKTFECRKCAPFIEKGHAHYFGPTRVGVSFVYLFKPKK